ncbi:hypothetical protein EDB83DRAFT_2457461 [Lactarius deliciosus]|nr:hypothetical protein EDB83DRAFT_2457461 [Lactarius deliciosus]
MPLIFHDCPYYTPFTSLLWYSAHILPFSILSFLYHCAHQMHKRWGTVGESMVKLFHHQQKTWSESFSRGMTSTLVNSAKRPSVYIYKQVLEGTLQWLRDDNNDEELEKFVTGIPGLFHYISPDDKGPHHPIRDVLAALPGPSSIHNSLPWGIMELAQRTVASSPTKLDKKQRTQACFRALYHIPGAIRDLLAPYAANEHLYMNILPLLDSPESLEVIKELWNATDNNVVLSVRCALAARVAFRITPPSEPDPLDSSTTPRRHSTEFFPRLGISAVADSGAIDPQSDTPLQNLVRFLGDITDGLQEVHKKQWMSDNADSIRRMRRELFDTRHVKGYGNAHKSFNQEGDRESPVFVPAAQQDLITLTLEVLARSVMKDTPKSALQDRGFPGAWHEFVEAAFTKALEGTGEDALKRAGDQARVPPASVLRTLARIRVQAADSFEMAERALRPVLDSFGLEVTMTKRHYVTEA